MKATTVVTTLELFIKERIMFAQNGGDWEVFCNQAFGGVQFVCELYPDLYDQVDEMWSNKYRPIFYRRGVEK